MIAIIIIAVVFIVDVAALGILEYSRDNLDENQDEDNENI